MSWRSVNLVDVCDFQGGTQPPKSEWITAPRVGYVRMIQIRDFTQGKESFVEYVKDSKTLKKCQEDDIMIGRYGASIGKILTGISGAYNVALVKTMPSDELDKRYFYHYLNTPYFQNFIQNAGSRAAQAGFNKEELKELEIPLPPLDTQKRIAEILDAADALRRKDQELLKKYDELTQAIFIDMFGDPVKNEKGWDVKSLGEVCHYIKDGPHVSPKYTSSGIPFISVNNIIKGTIDISNCKYISQEDFEFYSKKGKPERNDILYTKGGTTGFAKRVDVDFDFIQCVHVALLKFDHNNLNPVFLEYMLNNSFCYYQSQILTKGIANRDLVLGEIKKIKILFPQINFQEEFEAKVLLIERGKREVEISNNSKKELFLSLIQKAFKGELV